MERKEEEVVLPESRIQGHVEGLTLLQGPPGGAGTTEGTHCLLEGPPQASREGDKYPDCSLSSILPCPSSGPHWLNSAGKRESEKHEGQGPWSL